MVAEKPSIAESISYALAAKPSLVIKKSARLPIYLFPGEIFGERAYFKVTSVAGHVY